jgi:putative lipoprotein
MSLRKLSLLAFIALLALVVTSCAPAAQSAGGNTTAGDTAAAEQPTAEPPATEQPTQAPAETPVEATTAAPAETPTEAVAEVPAETPTAAATGASLEGTRWELVSIGDQQRVQSTVRPNLELAAGGVFRGSGGCNSFVGKYELGDGTIAFEKPTIGYRTCDAAGVMEQEQAYVNALASATAYTFSGDALTLETDAGTLTFERAGQP